MKRYLKSKTIWGLLVSAAGYGLGKAGLPVALAPDVIQLAGLLLAAAGRRVAQGPL